ncbi:MAG TPA: hypothetical protein VEC19_08930 [Usitatibacter sp.]|nr:hypothetical protein [Usitatibacter sp.]
MSTPLIRKPKSFIVFVTASLLALLLFAPVAIVGLSLERAPVFLAGTAGVAVTALTGAFMALLFAAGLYAGRYRELHPAPWREQVW